MNYWLHPEAREDLWEAAEYYRQRAGISLSQSLLAEFERSIDLLYAIRASEPFGGTASTVLSWSVSRMD